MKEIPVGYWKIPFFCFMLTPRDVLQSMAVVSLERNTGVHRSTKDIT